MIYQRELELTAFRQAFGRFFRAARAPRLRSMREFAEQEVYLPDGPYAGRLFRTERQPYTRLWLDAVDSGLWYRFAGVGPVQSGKTLLCVIIPTFWHLFEVGETVICGLPTMDVAADKWREDFLPALERSRYRDLLPSKGAGSRGGNPEAIKFKNGSTLRFMSGGGGDGKRSAFTSRVLVVTEADKLDETGANSREADKLTQMEARTRAFRAMGWRVYLECTASYETGRIWQEYLNSTNSRIALPCPHCGEHVTPEREHFHGWESAENVLQAGQNANFGCPECGTVWSEEDRINANADCRLVHKGQAIDKRGDIEGEPPETDTLGFRWSAVNNLFTTSEMIGQDCWNAEKSLDEENAEKEGRQFVWALPYDPPDYEEAPLKVDDVRRRQVSGGSGLTQGILPADTEFACIHVDLGKWWCHWLMICFRTSGELHIPDYGKLKVPSDRMDTTRAILQTLREFRKRVEAGWTVYKSGALHVPNQVWVDSRYQPAAAFTFAAESGSGINNRYKLAIGMGESQQRTGRYVRPARITAKVRKIGRGWHLQYVRNEETKKRAYQLVVNSDRWKTAVHESLGTPLGEPGAMGFFSGLPDQHNKVCKHLLAEKLVRKYLPGKGWADVWETVSKQNHWLDNTYNALAAGNFCGWSIITPEAGAAGNQQPATAQPGSWFAQQRKR